MAEPHTVLIRYFAWVRERTGTAEETVTLPPHIQTVSDVIAWLRSRGAEYEHAFERADVIRVAVDQQHVAANAPVVDAREIAFFPPVTGG